MKEILKHLVETTTLPEDSYLDQDAEILEIFVENFVVKMLTISTIIKKSILSTYNKFSLKN